MSIEKRSMKCRFGMGCLVVASLQVARAQEQQSAVDGCTAFRWNVTQELGVKHGVAIAVIALGNAGAVGAPLLLDRLVRRAESRVDLAITRVLPGG